MEMTLKEILIFTRNKAFLMSFLSHVFESFDTGLVEEDIFYLGPLGLRIRELEGGAYASHFSTLLSLESQIYTVELNSKDLLEEIRRRASFFYYRHAGESQEQRSQVEFPIIEDESVFLSKIVDPDGRIWALQTQKLV